MILLPYINFQVKCFKFIASENPSSKVLQSSMCFTEYRFPSSLLNIRKTSKSQFGCTMKVHTVGVSTGSVSEVMVHLKAHLFLWGLLVSKVEKDNAGQRTDKEDNIKPAMVEVELQFPKDLSDNSAIFQGHAHPHEQH